MQGYSQSFSASFFFIVFNFQMTHFYITTEYILGDTQPEISKLAAIHVNLFAKCSAEY